MGEFRGSNALERIVAYASSCGVHNSPGFGTKSVFYRYSQTQIMARVMDGMTKHQDARVV
jgi:hypothetical protein